MVSWRYHQSYHQTLYHHIFFCNLSNYPIPKKINRSSSEVSQNKNFLSKNEDLSAAIGQFKWKFEHLPTNDPVKLVSKGIAQEREREREKPPRRRLVKIDLAFLVSSTLRGSCDEAYN